MRSVVVKTLLGSFLVLAIVWALILGWWQSIDFSPSPGEMLLYLLGIPLALIVGYVLLQGFIEHLKKPVEVAAPNAPDARDDDPLARIGAANDAAERDWSLSLLAARLSLASGKSAEEMLAALAEGRRPAPSSRLQDDEGFPAFVSEVPDLDTDAFSEQLHATQPTLLQADESPAFLRALALLDGVLEASRSDIEPLLEASGEKFHLSVLCLLPDNWQPALMPTIRQYLGDRLARDLPGEAVEIMVLQAKHEVDALRQLDAAIVRCNRDPLDDEFLLVLGTVSAVDEDSVAQWAGQGGLFTAARQEGSIPGEGAVALLLTRQVIVDRLRRDNALSVSRLVHGSRDKRLDAGGRVGGKLIAGLFERLLETTATDAASVNAVLLDTDHRAAHMTEALEGLGEGISHLDPLKDVLAVGLVAGSLTPIGALLAIAAAGARSLAEKAPVVCLSNHHALERAMLIVRPAPAGEPETSTS